MKVVLLFLLFALALADRRPHKHTAEPDGDCDGVPFGRKQVWDCVLNVVDLNKDALVTADEVETALDTYLYTPERWMLRAAAGNLDHHMIDCCGTADCVLTYDLAVQYSGTCLDTQKNRCRFKEKVCDRAAVALDKKVY